MQETIAEATKAQGSKQQHIGTEGTEASLLTLLQDQRAMEASGSKSGPMPPRNADAAVAHPKPPVHPPVSPSSPPTFAHRRGGGALGRDGFYACMRLRCRSRRRGGAARWSSRRWRRRSSSNLQQGSAQCSSTFPASACRRRQVVAWAS